MAPRSRYASSEVSDHYEERSTRTGRGARDKRYYEEEEVVRERRAPPPRERETLIKEEVRSRDRPRSPPSDHYREDIRIRERARSPPDQFREDIRIRERAKSPTSYVREDITIKERPRTPPEYVREDIRIRERERPRTPPGYVREEYVRAQPVLRGRVREDFEFAPRPPPPRSPSPSPPPPPRIEREEIIIGGRREPEIRREPPPPRDFEREEIIIGGRREPEARREPPPPRDFEREEIIIGGRREPEIRREPPPPRDFEREEIIIGGRREPEIRREPPPPRDFEREEIIIRNNDREPSRRPPPRERDIDREELIIRDGPSSTRSVRGTEYERDEYVSRRGPPRDRSVESRFDRGPPPRGLDYDREEVIIRRDRDDRGGPRRRSRSLDRGFDREELVIRREDRGPPPPPTMTRVASPPRSRFYDDFDDEPPRPVGADALALTRVRSHERARSVSRHHENDNREIIIRRDRDERDSRRGNSREREREEIIIRRNERDRSSSPTSTIAAPMGHPEPPIIRAPPIHQEVITHHRHIDHGYEVVAPAPRPISRPPSPPSPPPPREERDETIEIHRRGERNGRPYDEDIIISDRDRERSHTPLPPPVRREYAPPPPAPVEPYRPPYAESPRRPYMDPRDERDIREEADYYNNRATDRGYPGEGSHGATKDWAIVDVPPGTRRVRMDGVGGGAQEVTWQRYNGVRRSKFMPDGGSDEGYGSAEAGPLALAPSAGAGGAQLGRRYEGVRDKKEALWTEITKDLVIREAIEEAGYEFEETDDFYYVIAYLKYVSILPHILLSRPLSPHFDHEDIARLVGLSEDIRHARRRRIKEMGWERRSHVPSSDKRSSSGAMLIEEEKRPLMIEGPPRSEKGGDKWDRESEIYREREVTMGRGPPPRRGW
ncbi:MAG: hypothetical protein Q9160_005361 [Pyrenula sp. 1 TL-2023]